MNRTSKYYYDHLNSITSILSTSERKKQVKGIKEAIATPSLPKSWDEDDILLPFHYYKAVAATQETLPPQIEAVYLHTLHQWNEYKQILLFSKELTKKLIETPLDNNIPTNLLKKLPYSFFYVATPGVEKELGLGFFCGLDVSINGELQIVAYIDTDETILDELLLSPMYFPLKPTIAEMLGAVKHSISEGDTAYYAGMLQRAKSFDQIYVETANIILNHLLYLLSAEADLDTSQGEKRVLSDRSRHKKAKQKNKNPKVTKVGYTISQYLAPVFADKANTGASKAPHYRRAHWHTYRVGKGKTQKTLKWISPTLVNADLVDKTNAPVSIKKIGK